MSKCQHCGYEHGEAGFPVAQVDQTENGIDIYAAFCDRCEKVVASADEISGCPHNFLDWQGFCIDCEHWIGSAGSSLS